MDGPTWDSEYNAVLVTPDDGAPIMTSTPALLTGSTLSFTNVSSSQLVTVPLSDGQRTTVIRLVADSVTVGKYRLQSPPLGSKASLDTDSRTVTYHGGVTLYVTSLTGTTAYGTEFALNTSANPPASFDLPTKLADISAKIVGIDAIGVEFARAEQSHSSKQDRVN